MITPKPELPDSLIDKGVGHLVAERHEGQLALPEILEDMASAGISTLLVEGGAKVAQSFVEANLVDEIALFTGVVEVGSEGIASPLKQGSIPPQFSLARTLKLGEDRLDVYFAKS